MFLPHQKSLQSEGSRDGIDVGQYLAVSSSEPESTAHRRRRAVESLEQGSFARCRIAVQARDVHRVGEDADPEQLRDDVGAQEARRDLADVAFDPLDPSAEGVRTAWLV